MTRALVKFIMQKEQAIQAGISFVLWQSYRTDAAERLSQLSEPSIDRLLLVADLGDLFTQTSS